MRKRCECDFERETELTGNARAIRGEILRLELRQRAVWHRTKVESSVDYGRVRESGTGQEGSGRRKDSPQRQLMSSEKGTASALSIVQTM